MPIFARKKESQFEPAPEGLHLAVCVDVWEPWTAERREDWGGGLVDKTRIVWVIDEENPKTGKPFEVSQIYTLSLHEKANLCKTLESWRGKKFTDQEKLGFDIEKLIGVNCQLSVAHKITDAGTYANVLSVVQPPKGAKRLLVPEGYVRKKDREPAKGNGGGEEFQADDGDVPFVFFLAPFLGALLMFS